MKTIMHFQDPPEWIKLTSHPSVKTRGFHYSTSPSPIRGRCPTTHLDAEIHGLLSRPTPVSQPFLHTSPLLLRPSTNFRGPYKIRKYIHSRRLKLSFSWNEANSLRKMVEILPSSRPSISVSLKQSASCNATTSS